MDLWNLTLQWKHPWHNKRGSKWEDVGIVNYQAALILNAPIYPAFLFNHQRYK